MCLIRVVMDNSAGTGVGTLNRRRNVGSRVYHCLLAVAFFILFLLGVVSVGIIAGTYNDVRTNSMYGKSIADNGYDGKAGTCILYADYPCSVKISGNKVDLPCPCLSDDTACHFAISGNALIALAALLLIGLSSVKAFMGLSA